MEAGELIQPNENWQSLIPEGGLPDDIDTWMIDVPHKGRLFISLADYPGGGGYEDDDKAFILNPELPGMAIDGQELLNQGFKTLDFALTPEISAESALVKLRLKGTDLSFESVFQKINGEGALKPNVYWINPQDSSEFPPMRDIMVKREQLKDIEIVFPKEVNN